LGNNRATPERRAHQIALLVFAPAATPFRSGDYLDLLHQWSLLLHSIEASITSSHLSRRPTPEGDRFHASTKNFQFDGGKAPAIKTMIFQWLKMVAGEGFEPSTFRL
jgi:hypothetical protein